MSLHHGWPIRLYRKYDTTVWSCKRSVETEGMVGGRVSDSDRRRSVDGTVHTESRPVDDDGGRRGEGLVPCVSAPLAMREGGLRDSGGGGSVGRHHAATGGT